MSCGPCPGCEECGLSEEPSNDEYDIASEGGFSSSSCECCNSYLGGMRYPAHGLIPNEDQSLKNSELVHLDVCGDCVYYLTYGCLDDDAMMEIEASTA